MLLDCILGMAKNFPWLLGQCPMVVGLFAPQLFVPQFIRARQTSSKAGPSSVKTGPTDTIVSVMLRRDLGVDGFSLITEPPRPSG